jgi:polyhydroxyalkanoate synthesis regulator phasin
MAGDAEVGDAVEAPGAEPNAPGQGQREAERRGGLPPERLPAGIDLSQVTELVGWVDSSQLGEVFHLAAALSLHPDMRYVVLDDDTPAGRQRSAEVIRFLREEQLAVDHGDHGVHHCPTPADKRRARARYLPVFQSTAMVAAAFDGDTPRQDAARAQVRHDLLDPLGSGAGTLAAAVQRFLAAQDPALLDPGTLKVVIWIRQREDHGADRNASPALVAQLSAEVRARGMTPVFMGTRLASMPEGIDLTAHWTHPPFNGTDTDGVSVDGFRAQLHLIDLLHREHGVVGEVGMRSGAMDGAALVGLPTISIGDREQRERRMAQWDVVPGYEQVDNDRGRRDNTLDDRARAEVGAHLQAQRDAMRARWAIEQRIAAETEEPRRVLLRQALRDLDANPDQAAAIADSAGISRETLATAQPTTSATVVVDQARRPASTPDNDLLLDTAVPRGADTAERGPSRPPAATHDVDVDDEGQVTVTRTRPGGAQSSVGVQATPGGATIQASHNPTGEAGGETSMGIGYQQQTNGDREVIGRDLLLNGGAGPLSIELAGGYTFDVQLPVMHADGRVTVSWVMAVRGEQGASLSSETASVGRRRGGSICARGTERFDGAGREENLARARTYRQHVREHAEAELAKFVNGDLAGADWWSGQPEGTSRTLEIEASRARSGSLSLLRALRIAPEASIVARGAVRLTRGAGTLLEVVLTRTIDATGGAIGGQIVGVAGGQTAHYTVRDVYVVDLAVDGSAASLSGFLETLAGFESGARGVRHTLHSVETSTGEYIGVDVAVVGGLRGGDNTGTIETTRYAENGDVVDTTRVHTSDDYFVGNTVTGHDSRRRHRVEAPESDAAYTFRSTVSGATDRESGEMLADELGVGGAGPRARRSGTWVVAEELTQEEALRFHQELLARRPRELTSELRAAQRALHEIPTDDERLIGQDDEESRRELARRRGARGEAIAALVGDRGRRGIQEVREVAGGTDDTQYVTLFDHGQADLTAVGELSAEEQAAGVDERARVETFLGRSGSQEIERRIRAQSAGLVTDGDVDAARADIAAMEARLARIGDVGNFTDLPREARAELIGRYGEYREGLFGVVRRGEEQAAGRLSADGQAHYAQLRAIQDRVDVARHATERAQADVIANRRRFGQMDGERLPEAPLPHMLQQATERRWSVAMERLEVARRARDRAEARLGQVARPGTPATEAERIAAYDEARDMLLAAVGEYEGAAGDLESLGAEYDRIDQRRAERRAAREDDERSAEDDTAERTEAPQEAPRAPSALVDASITERPVNEDIWFDFDAVARCYDYVTMRPTRRLPITQPGNLSVLIVDERVATVDDAGVLTLVVTLAIDRPFMHGQYAWFTIPPDRSPIANQEGHQFSVWVTVAAPPGVRHHPPR